MYYIIYNILHYMLYPIYYIHYWWFWGEADPGKTGFRQGRQTAAVRLIVECCAGPVFGPPWGGLRALASKRSKCLFLQCFGFSRTFLEPSRSVSRFFFEMRITGAVPTKECRTRGQDMFSGHFSSPFNYYIHIYIHTIQINLFYMLYNILLTLL